MKRIISGIKHLINYYLDKKRLHTVIFNSDTPAGKKFDIILLWAILLSVILVILESMPEIGHHHPNLFYVIDWVFTLLFTFEYILRIYSSKKRRKYIFSFWGIIDLLSILPTYLSLFVLSYHYLLVIRVLRLLRVFRILRLFNFTREGKVLLIALRKSIYKILVFITFIFIFVVIIGTVMYVIEHDNPGFSSIPASIYWGIVTITTVGFGDIVPMTYFGKFLASIIMLSGYAIIAVPTGIVTVELAKNRKHNITCKHCKHVIDAMDNYCRNCGKPVNIIE
ncbi:Ion transport protein [Pseudopedobacter saltans DSM 12145]|uniref:Ion transport protein n=1 Tax=Pseudopedobacter saltans (strain ATCC 51119 / DSM 12145 / JCM 21818 / CCUG 39354 / LMG 10337 / NBRC 100064 / NCIMB 13643) TaxID=762903 RepID=F0S9K2_PSESL|nr:ion transporter [Pseudopedobacter saltans]ADY53555.1 Ion transport protein [Pseudopedobacter saltans DSM 12145]